MSNPVTVNRLFKTAYFWWSDCYCQFLVVRLLLPIFGGQTVTADFWWSDCYCQFLVVRLLLPIFGGQTVTANFWWSDCYGRCVVVRLLPPILRKNIGDFQTAFLYSWCIMSETAETFSKERDFRLHSEHFF